MRNISRFGFTSVGTACLILGVLSAPSYANQGNANDLKAAATESSTVAGTQEPQTNLVSTAEQTAAVSFTKQSVGDLSVTTPSTKSSASPFAIAQVTDTQPAQSAPVIVDPQSPQQLPPAEQVAPTTVDPLTPTRAGRNYVGVGGNIGILGDPSVGETGLMVYSKFGLTRYFSVRPAITTNFVDNATVILPVTFDFAPIRVGRFSNFELNVAPYIGAGAAVNTNNGDVGPLLTAGIDVPITSRFTATAGVNAAFINNTGLGTFIGVGYNF